MPRKDHLPRQTRQEHITLQPNRSIEFRVTDDFGSFSPPHWHDALEIIYILEDLYRTCTAYRKMVDLQKLEEEAGEE